jgi:hypothetical protein
VPRKPAANARFQVNPRLPVELTVVLVHSVRRLEVLLCIGDQLSVARMIDGLYAHDFRLEGVLVLVDVLDQMEFRSGGANDENLGCVVESARNVMKKMVRVVRVLLVAILVDLLSLGVAVNVTMRRVYRGLVEALGQHVKDAGLVVVDPDG